MEILNIAFSLALVLALAYTGLWALKHLPTVRQRPSPLSFLAALPVGGRERLVLIRWNGRDLLVGVSAGSISVIAEGVSEPDLQNDWDERPNASPTTVFSRLAQRWRRPG
jgi:flagellar protein FliO/FliZ